MASYAADFKCPVCSKELGEPEYQNAARQLDKGVLKRYGEQSRKSKQEFDRKISELKAAYRKQAQAAAKKHQAERKSLQKRLKEQARKGRETRERELRHAKKNYQAQLENIRSIYHGQHMALQNSYSSQLEEAKRNYEHQAASSQAQVDKLQKWLREVLVDEPFKKLAMLEQEKTSSEQQIANLVQQLDDKNNEVILLQERARHLDGKVPVEANEQLAEEDHQMDSKYHTAPEEPEGEEQKEWLSMIKELAQQRELREGEMEGDAEAAPEQQSSWGSKVAKRFGLF